MKPADKTFVISGGCSGLGLATALGLHSAGAYISLLDLNAENGEKILKQLKNERVAFFETDVSDPKSVQAAVDGTVKWIEKTGKPMAGCIPAAGVGLPAKVCHCSTSRRHVVRIYANGALQIYDARSGTPVSLEKLDFVLNINLRGTLDLIRLCVPHMVKTEPPLTEDGERGIIIMVASSAAFDGQMGQVAYAASKGAVASLTLPLARDLAKHGIRAVTIAPSLFDSAMTKMMPKNVKTGLEKSMEFPMRAGRPDEFASLAMQAVENSMLNGTVLRLDGAMRMPSKM